MSEKRASRLRKSAAVGAAAVALVGAWEGLQLVAYRDVIGIPTICYGETQGVKMGDRYTAEQCRAMLRNSLEKYALAVEYCVTRPMPDTTYISFVSLSYNIGTAGFCRSSVARLYNEGKTREACDFMLRYNRAGGVVWRGLTNRREAERKLCLQGANL
jgi:lysozyme